MLDINLIWFGYIARLSQRGGEGILLVQKISTCLRCAEEGGGGGQHRVRMISRRGGGSAPCENDKTLLPFLPLVLFLDLTKEDEPSPLQKKITGVIAKVVIERV
jgi:hypothetical protein